MAVVPHGHRQVGECAELGVDEIEAVDHLLQGGVASQLLLQGADLTYGRLRGGRLEHLRRERELRAEQVALGELARLPARGDGGADVIARLRVVDAPGEG